MIDISNAEWRKSSRSSSNGQCVEIARNLPGIVAVRDSKNRDGGHLAVEPVAWAGFLTEVVSGRIEA